ncbi:MAG: ATP-dependent Clp protease ATP-binding subunit [Ruminococcaceae bacterium]|nr:ATP-dependent Clp protease ATP-binding subunit [Oscillospiraceae bacterium]
MLCTRCKKRQAVVFITGMFGDSRTENAGLCMTCAREMGIPQVDSLMKQMGLDDEGIEEMENRLADMAQSGELPFGMGMISPNEDDDDDDISEDGESSLIEMLAAAKNDDSDDVESQGITMRAEDVDDAPEESDGEEREHKMFPFEQLFGGSFQFGGATYSDDGKNSDKKKNRNKKRGNKEPRFLSTYCTNLTAKAREGKLDRIIGRDREIERIVQILSRRSKNNPCLIGEPGVGKTAIAEGLALRIAAADVPAKLAVKELYLLDLTALVAGTQFRGQFESRMKGLIDEVKSRGNVILFIDEVHNLVGTGDAEGSMNAANIMKPALSRGELQVIGATTFNEYRKHIEKDSALERRFQPVKVDEPSAAETVEVLKGIKDYYERHHAVSVSDSILHRAVTLSERYITDRFFPDKAIDLLDEACACAALRNKARAELDKINIRLEELSKQKNELSEGDEEPDYEKLAQLTSEIMKLDERASELRPEAEGFGVTEADLARVIELWTGIQASRVEESEFSKLSALSDRIKEKVKGQDEAVDMVSAAIRRSRVQISPRRRPASFIFVGPTGVGKTELVKVLAAELFSTPETLIRLDMSEYMEKHSVSKIIGSPPGYVGYDEAGQLTEKVRRKPYSVLLFDEIEKAHPDVLNILLQILDEGRINDAQGRTVSFENTVIIMTSNAGSDKKDGAMGFAKSEADLSKEKALKALSDFLRPEFLARVDEVVVFNPLSDDDFCAIGRLMTDEYISTMLEKGIKLNVTDEAVKWLADHAKGGKSSARDLRNLIRKEIEDRLATMIIDRYNNLPDSVRVVVKDDAIALETD